MDNQPNFYAYPFAYIFTYLSNINTILSPYFTIFVVKFRKKHTNYLQIIIMKIISIIMTYVVAIFATTHISAQQISFNVQKIWGDGLSHCAFTSLIHYKGRYYCAFREGESHIFDKNGNAEGKIRIITSKDGTNWESVAFIGKEGIDLRDPKLSVMPDGRMLVTIGGSVYRNRILEECIPHVMFTEDGKTFTSPKPAILDKKMTSKRDWIWRITWHDGVGYGVSYNKAPDGDKNGNDVWLVKTYDAESYEAVTKLQIDGYPNEATIRFLPDGRMAIMIRREAGDTRGWWGTSSAPYTDWEWKRMGLRLGGPDFIVLDDNRIVMGTRNYAVPGYAKTCIYTGNNNGVFEEAIVLPSGGDNSYPSIITVADELWVSYYSAHEGTNPSIYLAKIPMSNFRKQ